MKILALDPGPQKTGIVLFEDGNVLFAEERENSEALFIVKSASPETHLAIEMIASYGMSVGAETFDSCVWIGRFQQAYYSPETVQMVLRRDVKTNFCGTMKAKDANIRQFLIDKYGGKEKAVGSKKNPGPIYGVTGHLWSALAVAVYAHENPQK